MEKYTGTKTIKAKPMLLGDYNILRGWTIPADEDPLTEGYFVGYPDAHSKFDGHLHEGSHHISWSPKDVFEASYVMDGHVTCGKTLHNSKVSAARKNVKDIRIVGNGDAFKLLFKASSEKEGWMKSTKAMDTGIGCLVQVTTQQKNPDGSYALAEALTFVKDVEIVHDENNGRKLQTRRISKG